MDRTMADSGEFVRDVDGRQHKIDRARPGRIRRHLKVFRGSLVLGKGDATGHFDGNAASRPVRTAARQNDSDRAIAAVAR